VVVLTYCVRSTFFRKTLEQIAKRNEGKVADQYVTSLIPGRKWFPFLEKLNRFLMRLLLLLRVGRLDARNTILWCYWPEGFELAKKVGSVGKLIFDADHNIVKDTNGGERNPEMEKVLLQCAAEADLIVAGSRSMLKWFSERGARRSIYLRNGVNLERFAAPTFEPEDIKKLPKPRIGYVGMLSGWIDFDLLDQIALRRSDWIFIVIGDPYKASIPQNLLSRRNILFLGNRNSRIIPQYLASFDVALALYRFRDRAWLDGDSMKLFEYLAAGVPVVSTRFHEYLEQDFDHLLQCANDVDSVEGAIEKVLNQNSQATREWHLRRQRFLKINTWAHRAQEALDLVRSI
jgi:glycosyltransferase involved in cell wall biosynthesis